MKFNRRSVFTMIPAASALLSLRSKGAPIPAEAITSAGFSISVQCWSFRKFSWYEAVEMAARAGTNVEIFPGQLLGGPHADRKVAADMDDQTITSMREHLAKHGVTAINFGVVEIPPDEAGARTVFEFAKKMGLYGVTTESLAAIDTLEKLAKEYDMKVCFHNHPKPTRLWDPETIWKAVDGRHQNLGYCADLGHWATSGLDPLEVIKNVAPRVLAFHMKDRASVTQWTHDRPFGTGVMDLVGILDEVRKHGFAGNVSIEYEHNWETNLPEVAQCAGYLRAYSRMRI